MKQSLGKLMEGFVALSQGGTTMPASKLPIKVSQPDNALPVVPINRWVLEDKKRLCKQYDFKTIDERNQFLTFLLQYEQMKGHFAEYVVSEKQVQVRVWTKTIDGLTDLDKEFAKECDVLFKDVVAKFHLTF